jgi:hypothetical protein
LRRFSIAEFVLIFAAAALVFTGRGEFDRITNP